LGGGELTVIQSALLLSILHISTIIINSQDYPRVKAWSEITYSNKRSIAHKGSVDPNTYDLKYIYTSSQWILSEIVRELITSDMNLAGRMIEFIQTPVSSIIEEFGNRKLVYGHLIAEKEIMVLLYSHYPEYASRKEISASLDRRSESTISNSLKKL
jgi:hypothetical protein